MKKAKYIIVLIILTSCYSPKLVEWRVTEYKKEGERWIVTAKSARGTEKFITDCKPDSVGSRFLAKPKSIKN